MELNDTAAWFIVLAYGLGCILCFLAARTESQPRERHFWIIASICLLLLGLNKQLDLQTLITDQGRELAKAQGWYEARRTVQGAFLLVLVVGAAGMAGALAFWLRGARASVWAGVSGLLLLTAFVLVRAATIHHIDIWVTVEMAGLRRGRWLELIGIAVVAASAMAFRKRVARTG